jgi:Zn ribbon nucleic-acid-binding protein
VKIYRIYRSQFINGVVCDVVLASDAEALEKENGKLRAVLERIVNYDAECDCPACWAKEALEEK